jgi:hypothetical protein
LSFKTPAALWKNSELVKVFIEAAFKTIFEYHRTMKQKYLKTIHDPIESTGFRV